MGSFKRAVTYFLVLQLSLLSPLRIWAEAQASGPIDAELFSGIDSAAFKGDTLLTYWGKIDAEQPWLGELALGDDITPGDEPPWRVGSDNPLTDADPFFLRSQSWESTSEPLSDCADYCFSVGEDGSVNVHVDTLHLYLSLNKDFEVVAETEARIYMKSRTAEIFRAKFPGQDQAGQGVFFINKKDIPEMVGRRLPVPVFHFPLPGSGWVGEKVKAIDLTGFGQVAFVASSGYRVEVDVTDIIEIEKVSRKNFVLAQMQTLIANKLEVSGIALPLPHSTMAFGLLPSNNVDFTKLREGYGFLEKADQFFENFLMPKAHAEEGEYNRRAHLRRLIDERLAEMQAQDRSYVTFETDSPKERPSTISRWLPPALMYGSTGAAAVLASSQIDFNKWAVDGMGDRIAIIFSIFAVTAVAAIVLKYTLHRKHFGYLDRLDEKLYDQLSEKSPRRPTETFTKHLERLLGEFPDAKLLGEAPQRTALQRANQHHKEIMTEYVHGLFFGMSGPGQAIRHSMDYLKDRYFSGSKLVQTGWEATMGFFIQQSSRLPVNHKTFYLGAVVMGMSDSVLVAVDLLIFTPFLMQFFDVGAAIGGVAAAFATSEVLRNFISYLQAGAHDYAGTVKLIHMKKAEKEANRILRAQGKDPEHPRNGKEKKELIARELERTYKSVGLPGANEFLYDPVTILEATVAKGGYSLDRLRELPQAEKEALAAKDFLFSHRYWGKVVPAMKLAIETANKIQAENPTPEGEKVLETLKWASQYRGFFTPASMRDTFKSAFSLATRESQKMLSEYVAQEVNARLEKFGKVGMYGKARAAVVGTYKYLRQPQIQAAKDIRLTLFLMSNTGNFADVVQYLPEQWLNRAGSPGAGQAAAELFHRALFTLHTHKDQGIEPSRETRSSYGERANKVIAEMGDAKMADPFLREVRFRQVVAEIAESDRARFDIANFMPENLQGLERVQWQRAMKAAAPLLDTMEFDSRIGEKWKSMAQLYSETTGEVESEKAQERWVRDYQRKMIITGEMAAGMGLILSGVEKSEILDRVITSAAKDTADELRLETNKEFVSRLSSTEKEFYEARIFYNHFISHYMRLTVQNENMSALSPEFPGRFQNFRIRFAGSKRARPLLFVTRIAESLLLNDGEAYIPGLKAAVARNIPFVSDLYQNFFRDLRIMPYTLSIGYLTSYYIWQIHMPYSMFAFMLLFSFTHPVMVEMNNRLMRNFDIKPMGDVPSKLTYSFIHSRLTNPIIMLQLAFAGTIASWLTITNLAAGFIAVGTIAVGKLAWDQRQERRRERALMEQTEVRDGERVWRRGQIPGIDTGLQRGTVVQCRAVFQTP